jgi:F-type H+-transporting ATPase subunit gamma
MPENKKAVLRRIKAVKATQQITKAMKMIAAAKLRRAQEKVLAARPYARELAKTLSRLVAGGAGANHPLLQEKQGNRTVLYVVMTADRGLAGPYNVSVLRKATAVMQADPRSLKLVTIGRKARDYFRRRKITPIFEYVNIGEEPTFALAREVVHRLIALYLSGEVDEVRLVYTEFIGAINQRPVEAQLLPVQPPEGGQAEGPQMEYIYVPAAEQVLDVLVPRFAETVFYQAVLEAKASEHGARMRAMSAATDNAKEMIGKLTLRYNRARQAGITKEIAEIVGGAEAIKG